MQKQFFLFATVALLSLNACDNVAKGPKVEANEAQSANTESLALDFKINPATSKITWEGSKPTGKHSGTIAFKEGGLAADKGVLEGGVFTIDMNTITNTDLDDKSGKTDLEGHLKGADFFDVAQHPTAKFEITAVKALEGNKANITGNLTLKGITKSITFDATVSGDDTTITADAPTFVINRVDWGVQYQSKSLAATAKDKIINDEISLSFHIEAKK